VWLKTNAASISDALKGLHKNHLYHLGRVASSLITGFTPPSAVRPPRSSAICLLLARDTRLHSVQRTSKTLTICSMMSSVSVDAAGRHPHKAQDETSWIQILRMIPQCFLVEFSDITLK
jgi:hypothetical protein